MQDVIFHIVSQHQPQSLLDLEFAFETTLLSVVESLIGQ